MDTDVYLLCPVCKSITDGVESGDFTDIIRCQACSNNFEAKPFIRYNKYPFNEEGIVTHNSRKLYIPIGLEI